MSLDDKVLIEHKIKKARGYEAQGLQLHAVQIYESLINEYPDFLEAYYSLADLYEYMGNVDPALKLLSEKLKEDPENKELRIYLGQYLMRSQQWEEVIDILSYILPEEEPTVSFFIGYCYFMLKEYEISKLNFLSFITYSKQTEMIFEAYLYLAKIEIELKNFESALKYTQKTEAVYSNYWEMNLIAAKCYYFLGMYEHAVKPVEKGIKLKNDEPLLYEYAGKIYLKIGDYEKSEKNFLKFLDIAEKATADIYANLGEVCLKAEKPKDALAYYETALKMDPGNKFAEEGRRNASKIIE